MPLAGLQVWVALPTEHEETAPAFAHHAAAALPQIDEATAHRLTRGRRRGLRRALAGARCFADTFYVACDSGRRSSLAAASRVTSNARAYIVEGRLRSSTDGRRSRPGSMLRASTPGTMTGAPRTGRPAPRHAARWRAAGRAAPCLVELRVQFQGTHRAGEGGLGGAPLRQVPDEDGIHPAARAKSPRR